MREEGDDLRGSVVLVFYFKEKINFCISRVLFVSSSLLLLDLEFILFAELISFADSYLHGLLHFGLLIHGLMCVG
jgi:hypothetical protein